MSFFSELLKKNGLDKHDGRPLWKYSINENEFQELTNILRSTSHLRIDHRDATLFYAHWWKINYNGGKPSKQEIFDSVDRERNASFTSHEFYQLARKGAELLRIKWVKKQYTLYFKTLLLQGGLPLKHISENEGRYKDFLEAVLKEQPETIEDFIFKSDIVNLLPKSSQNDTVYENCLEIVKSILAGDGQYDELLESEESLKKISRSLKIKRDELKINTRQSKPKNYWLLDTKNNTPKISLRLGLSDTYSDESLSGILGFEATERNYQLFIDDELVCVFRKMIYGRYKTDWYNQAHIEWDSLKDEIPNVYVVSNELQIELPNFIHCIPSFEEPSLWVKFNENQWKFTKGHTASNQEAALLFPSQWSCINTSTAIFIQSQSLYWVTFEGEIIIQCGEKKRTFRSGVDSFDWIIESKKPKWMLRTNMPVVNGIPKVWVYDDDGYDIKKERFKVWVKKHNDVELWQDISTLKYLSTGCFDLKIDRNGLIAYDVFFNIGNLSTSYTNQSIDAARIEFNNLGSFECNLYPSEFLQIEADQKGYNLQVNIEHLKIPSSVRGRIGFSNKKTLLFELTSPFQGMVITDKNGEIIDESQPLSLANLYGMRILCSASSGSTLKIKNSLKNDVVISKEIKVACTPLISFKDEIERLYYLSDAMDYKNTVTIELAEGRNKQSYNISGFSHTLDVSNQRQEKVSLYNSTESLELYAIPINCISDKIEPIPLFRDELTYEYEIPHIESLNQFIVISSKSEGKQLMPRFVCTDDNFVGTDKNERIENYHTDLSSHGFDDEIWKQLLEYYNICVQFSLPFSTFDQLRAISRSSVVASRAFFYFGMPYWINYNKGSDDFIQKEIPKMEKGLGFCFHWIYKSDWENAFQEINELTQSNYSGGIYSLLKGYMKNNGLDALFKYFNGEQIKSYSILNSNIFTLRSQLGTRVLEELPNNSPIINDTYGINIDQHHQVRLLLQSPIAVAESIIGYQREYSIWGGDERIDVIRRNIQYSQYLKPDFYNSLIVHVLKKS